MTAQQRGGSQPSALAACVFQEVGWAVDLHRQLAAWPLEQHVDDARAIAPAPLRRSLPASSNVVHLRLEQAALHSCDEMHDESVRCVFCVRVPLHNCWQAQVGSHSHMFKAHARNIANAAVCASRAHGIAARLLRHAQRASGFMHLLPQWLHASTCGPAAARCAHAWHRMAQRASLCNSREARGPSAAARRRARGRLTIGGCPSLQPG